MTSTWANDACQAEGPCLDSILQGVPFWAANTPEAAAIKYPASPSCDAFETVTWMELKLAVELAAHWLQTNLGLSKRVENTNDEADLTPSHERTVTLLIAPSHDNICVWLALASMGYSTQFISPAHTPDVIADLITKAESRAVLFSGLGADWIESSRQQQGAMETVGGAAKPTWTELPSTEHLSNLIQRARSGEAHGGSIDFDTPAVPAPFVVLHSFGSTSNPKLYPLKLDSANLSARDAGGFWAAAPPEQRWRCQLQTSLPFHFSFQNPVWRMLMCGTTLAFPTIRANADAQKVAQSKGGVTLVPDAADVLDSLYLSASDVLYASPTGLTNMLLTSEANEGNQKWKKALAHLKEAHSGGAPTSMQMADLFTKHGLMVMQVFATTEAGMLFMGKPSITGHLCYLTPRPQLKDKLLFHKSDAASDTLELWLPEDFPGLQKHGLHFEPFPDDPTIMAWNTSDTFAKVPGPHPLYTFRGRTDDWLRLTSGTACRALEIESRFQQVFKEESEASSRRNSAESGNGTGGKLQMTSTSRVEGDGTMSPTSSMASSVFDNHTAGTAGQSPTSPLSSTFSSASTTATPSRVRHVAAIGNAQKTLAAVVQLEGLAQPNDLEIAAAHKAADVVTEEQLQYPAVLKPEAVVFASPEMPLGVTQKGSLQRKKNEDAFAPVMVAKGIF